MNEPSAQSPAPERPEKRRAKPGLVGLPFVGRTPPHSLEAEEYLLSCCLLDGADLMPRCAAARIAPESFYLAGHGLIFEALAELYAAQQPTDVACVAEHLKTKKLLDAVGGYTFLAQVSSRIPTTAQAGFFLAKVRELWILRQIILKGTGLVEEVYAFSGEPLAEFLSPHVVWFEKALGRLSAGGRGDVYTLEKRIAEVRADVKLRAAGGEDRAGWIWTGFNAFDGLDKDGCLRPLGSLEEDHNVLIGGGSSHGKSVLMRQLAGQALISGQRVVVYTLETTVKGFVRALAASWAGVNLLLLKRTPADLLKKLDDCCEELAELADKRLFVFQHEPGMSLRKIEEVGLHARRWAMQHGTPHLIALDYLQLVGTEKRCNSREQEVAEVSNGWQALQRELGCVTVAGAQLNESGLREMRKVQRDENDKIIHRMPNRGDLRESQSMYHAADVVWFLYQPPEDCRGADQSAGDATTPETWIVQDKRRNGVRGICRTWFQKPYLRFREIGADEGVNPGRPAAPVAPGTRVSKNEFRGKNA